MSEPSSKRRKVRKGTRNCWECKRRKVRCIFASSEDTACNNCIKRGDECLSQEHVEEPGVHTSKTQDRLELRLSRVEGVLNKLARDESLTTQSNESSEAIDINLTPYETIITPVSESHSSNASPASEYNGLARDLVAVWPAQHDIDRICQLSASLSTHLHMLFRVPSPAANNSQIPSTQEMLQLPPPGSHPVLIAQKLLMLGSLLQGALSVFPEALREHYAQISLKVVDTASRLVTTNEDLTTSVEGITCIMIEAMIQNYAGKLHRSWITLRRAISVAQLIGLHRNQPLASNRFLDPGTRSNFDADHLCLHMVQMDRYLSLTLGLPYSSLECATTVAASASVQPLDRMARLQCAIAERIMRRNGEEHTNMSEIDTLLREASDEMPPQWWLTPSLEDFHKGGLYPLHEVMRICYQLSHYHLLIRLHLPCLVSGHSEHSHSKITIAHASREILSRFIAFRAWTPGGFYCRGIDYLAFIALTAMCIAHIEVRSHADASTTSFLAHTHASDRGLIERAHQILKDMENDEIAARLSIIMQHLLNVEADAATGVGYSAVVTKSDNTVAECGGELVDGDGRLQVHVPYFGTIKFQRKARGATESEFERLLYSPSAALPNAAEQSFSGWDEQWSQPLTTFDDDWTLQNINGSLFGSLFGGLEDGNVSGHDSEVMRQQ